MEPPTFDRLPFSLLYHQSMSTLASAGELTPSELAEKVLKLNYFQRISIDDFKLMLQHLIKIDHMEKTEEGRLIVGLSGEKIVNNFKFYAVFKENEEYTVRFGSEELGTIVMPPPPGEKIAIAGHVWLVEEVDHKRRTVYCDSVKGQVPAYFGECPGDINTKILERMRRVLCEEKQYPYLMKNAVVRLEQARKTAELSGVAEKPLINLGGDMWAFFPWLGTYAFLAKERILKLKCAKKLGISNLESSRPYFIQFKMKAGDTDFFKELSKQAENQFDPLDLVYPNEIPIFEKYDEYLPPELVKKGFAYGILDIDGAKKRIKEIKRNYL